MPSSASNKLLQEMALILSAKNLLDCRNEIRAQGLTPPKLPIPEEILEFYAAHAKSLPDALAAFNEHD